jgi:lipid-A-disaccharide synthase
MKIFVSAGEVSGDTMLGSLLDRIKISYPELQLAGLGGSKAVSHGLKPLFPLAQTAVSGGWDVLRSAFFLLHMYRKAVANMQSFGPNLVILVDYPGLNLRLAQRARKLGIPVFFLVPPQAWAYRNAKGRTNRTIQALAGCSIHVLFPFEVSAFSGEIHSVSQGHFFVTSMSKVTREKRADRRILLCPGSRLPVLRRNLPLWLDRLERSGFFEDPNGEVEPKLGVLVPDYLESEVARCLLAFRSGKLMKSFRIWTDKEAAMSAHDLALAFPGTITLELALHRIPTLVLAVLDPLTLAIGKRVLKTHYLALPNLLLSANIFPEWVGTRAALRKNNFTVLWQGLQNWNQDWGEIQSRLLAALGHGNGAEMAAQECFRLLEPAINPNSAKKAPMP